MYEYCPPQAAEKGALQAAKERGDVVWEDTHVSFTSGAERWKEFYEKTKKGEPCTVTVSFYSTRHFDSELDYKVHKGDFPKMDVYDLSYDGETYTVKWKRNENPYQKQFKYLIPFDAEDWPSKDKEIRYVLTNDDTLTVENTRWGGPLHYTPQYEIDQFWIYTECVDEKNG